MNATKILLAATALVFSLGAYSQTDTTKKDTSTHKNDTLKKKPGLTESTTNLQETQSATTQQATNTTEAATTNAALNNTTTTANSNTAATGSTATAGVESTTPKPNFGRYYIPVLGNYNAVATSSDNKSLKVTPDENNPGKVWVEGLTETKFYALLKAAPGTYKIPAQKLDDKSVAEGTLIYDENSKQISVCSGCGYNEKAPTATEVAVATDAAAETAKNTKHHKPVEKIKKATVISFTGTKADQGTVSLLQ